MIVPLRLWVLWLLLFCSSSTYANSYIYGYTPNVATNGMTWGMNASTLGVHGIGGMDISSVIVGYKAIKNLEDDLVVKIGNSKVGGGTVWEDTEDWSQKYGGKIKKVIPIPYTPLAVFGDGYVKKTGQGTIEDVSVIYLYRFDSCFNPQSDPSCSGYVKPKPPPVPDIPDYDATEDEAVRLAQEETDKELLDDEDTDKSEEEEEEGLEIELLLANVTNALTIANEVSQAAQMKAINNVTNINSYYVALIPDNYYPDAPSLQGGTNVDNRRALRSLANDNLMNEMIEEQYK